MEVGAGTGANFKYYPSGTDVVCVDPNPHFDSYLKSNSEKFPHVHLEEFVLGKAEDMSGVETGSVDSVVCTLVLCSVEDVDQSLAEIKRVLRKVYIIYMYFIGIGHPMLSIPKCGSHVINVFGEPMKVV